MNPRRINFHLCVKLSLIAVHYRLKMFANNNNGSYPRSEISDLKRLCLSLIPFTLHR